jgi:hypothetical protein
MFVVIVKLVDHNAPSDHQSTWMYLRDDRCIYIQLDNKKIIAVAVTEVGG